MENFTWQSDHGSRVLIDNLRDGIFVIDDGIMTYVNPRLAAMLGRTVNEVMGLPFIELIALDERSLVWERHRARLAGETVPEQYELHLVTGQGTLLFCSLNVSLTETPQGKTVAIGSIRDITQYKTALTQLEASKMELKSIFDELPDVFYRTNMQGTITMISPSCVDVLAYTQKEMLGRQMADFYVTPEERQKVVQAISDGGGKATRVEAGLKHKNGKTIWISTNAFIRFDANQKPISVDGVARDITERKRMEEQLLNLSRTDGLTEVYSRSYFLDKSEAVVEVMKRYSHPASLMMMDLDHFKKINDKYGHHVGDLALVAFTMACRKEIREADILGRLGGEEFALLLPETTLQNAEILAERIRKGTAAINIPFGDNTIKITVSIGVVELNDNDTSVDSLLRRADLAMYQAKEKGRNLVVTAPQSA